MGNGLYSEDDAGELMVAYRGKYMTDENGQDSTCFENISDIKLDAKFQVSNDEGESYRTGETIKFSSNIALRKITSAELPVRFYEGNLKLCK
jgi:hypothetical protein